MTFRGIQIVTRVILGGTLFYTVGLYALIASGNSPFGEPAPIPMQYVGAAGFVIMAISVVVRRRLLANVALDDPVEVRLPAYGTAVIVAMAIAEGGWILILNLAIVAGAAEWILVGGLAAMLLVWLGRPRREEIGLSE